MLGHGFRHCLILISALPCPVKSLSLQCGSDLVLQSFLLLLNLKSVFVVRSSTSLVTTCLVVIKDQSDHKHIDVLCDVLFNICSLLMTPVVDMNSNATALLA